MWITNRKRNPHILLRNAHNLYVPAHHMATVKRFPIFDFPRIWNEAADVQNNPLIKVFPKNIKPALLRSITE